jgi:quercetin dioxygenase-like cupin family protein
MILQKIIEELSTAKHPIAKALHKGQHFRVLGIGFKKRMILKEHQTQLPSKLFILNGEVIYKEGENCTILSIYQEIEIPINTLHSIEAIQDSICLLTQG